MSKSHSRRYRVGGKDYLVSITAGEMDEQKRVHLRIVFRALYGNKSVCLVRGATNRSYWHDYPDTQKFLTESISLTPRIACALIAQAHVQGWNPEASNTNFEMFVTNGTIPTLDSGTGS